jgi:hypothetical protein
MCQNGGLVGAQGPTEQAGELRQQSGRGTDYGENDGRQIAKLPRPHHPGEGRNGEPGRNDAQGELEQDRDHDHAQLCSAGTVTDQDTRDRDQCGRRGDPDG